MSVCGTGAQWSSAVSAVLFVSVCVYFHLCVVEFELYMCEAKFGKVWTLLAISQF